jgi:hypothetical protein
LNRHSNQSKIKLKSFFDVEENNEKTLNKKRKIISITEMKSPTLSPAKYRQNFYDDWLKKITSNIKVGPCSDQIRKYEIVGNKRKP